VRKTSVSYWRGVIQKTIAVNMNYELSNRPLPIVIIETGIIVAIAIIALLGNYYRCHTQSYHNIKL